MATVEQLGRSGDRIVDGNKSSRRRYSVQGAADEEAARTALYNFLVAEIGSDPPDLDDLLWWDIQVDEKTHENWEGSASWKRFQRQVGESQFNFEVGVESTRVVIPVGAIAVYKAAGEPDLALQLIGDRGDGKPPEGVEIPVPIHEESETHWIASGDVSAFKAAAKSLVGKTNNALWKGHAAGEVLMRGVSGARRGLGDWELTCRWAVRENQTGLTIGSITGISKGGWQFLWPISKVRETYALQKITHVGVATVFQSGTFTDLGIG